MRILLADDHAIVRHGLKDILARDFPESRFGEVETAQAALESVAKSDWDVLLFGLTMPGRSGLDVLQEIRQNRPALPILVLSMLAEEQDAVRVLQAGASGYVSKVRAAVDLVEAVKKVLSGGKYLSAAVAEKLVHALQSGSEKPPHERLSNREFQIMRMIASGQAVKEIAAELSLSPQTVSTHRARLLKKMGLRATTELIRYALKNKLVD